LEKEDYRKHMTYISTINNQQYTVTLGPPDTHGHLTSIDLDKTSIPVDWQKIATFPTDTTGNSTSNTSGGQYSLILAGKSYQVFARPLPAVQGQAGQRYEIFLAGQRFEVVVEDERTRLLAGLTRTRTRQNAANVQAPMPGLVVNVLVQLGDIVTQNQTVVVLEAMKMENDLPAPTTGMVKEVRINKGQTVDQGEVLIIIESRL
jgi:biotin carboxyl carrier protein